MEESDVQRPLLAPDHVKSAILVVWLALKHIVDFLICGPIIHFKVKGMEVGQGMAIVLSGDFFEEAVKRKHTRCVQIVVIELHFAIKNANVFVSVDGPRETVLVPITVEGRLE